MVIFIVILVSVVVIAIILTVMGLRSQEFDENLVLTHRLDELSQDGEPLELRNLEMSMPFQERVVYPIARKLGEFATRFTPQNAMQSIEKKLELAGVSSSIDPTIILAAQFFGMVLFGGLIL